MKINQDTFLLWVLLSDALWHSEKEIPVSLTEEETRRLKALAEKQAVMGLVIDSLVRRNVKMPQICVFEAIGRLEQIKQQNRIVNGGVVKLHRLMTEGTLTFFVMKGQAVASYYPDALLRQSGDIDYYCRPEEFEQSLTVVKEKWGVQPEIHGSEKHADYVFQGNRYEPHYILTDLHSEKANEYLKKIIDEDNGAEVDIDGVKIRTFSPTLHTLYLFLHIYFHLVEVGVGLRQFCDLAVVLHAGVDLSSLKKHLEALGMVRAFRACEYILAECLGLSEGYLPYDIRPVDRKYSQRMLKVVLYRGNMGHYNKRNGWSGLGHQLESASIKMSHFVKFFWLSPGYHIGWLWHEVKRGLWFMGTVI